MPLIWKKESILILNNSLFMLSSWECNIKILKYEFVLPCYWLHGRFCSYSAVPLIENDFLKLNGVKE